METMNYEEKIIEFISFCIENFKMRHKLKGKEVANLFKSFGVITFLSEGYEVLHTQDKKYLIEEIEIFLRNRGYKI